MSFTKISEVDKTGKKITELSDIPDLTADELKARFDSFPNMIVEKHNELIYELESENAATNIGATAPEGITPSNNTMQEVVNAVAKEALKKQDTEEGKGLSTNDYSDEEKQKVDLNTQSRHSHSNKNVLDSITSTVKAAYDKIVEMLNSITEVSDTVKNSSSSLPTGKAIVSYVEKLGGGDMQKSVYDADNDGVVDDSAKLGGFLPSSFQKVTDNTLNTTDQTVTGAINEVFEMAQNGGKNLVGDEFSEDVDYPVGGYCIKDNVLCKFPNGKAAGPWDDSVAVATTCAEEFKSLNSNNEWKFWKEVKGTEIIALPSKFAEIKVEVFFSNTYSYLFEIAYVQLKDDMRQYLTGYGSGGVAAVCYLNMSKTQAYVSRVYNNTDVTATSIVSVYYR